MLKVGLAASFCVEAVLATSPNPLDDAGWELVAHMSNSGGVFDGDGDLSPNYSYGTFNSHPAADTPDFERAFSPSVLEILFITGDGKVWAITDYSALRALIDARGADFNPNIAFEVGIDGVISKTVGNVLIGVRSECAVENHP
ncbi:hypothetical protein CCP3SC1AL1_2620001 [Gammaproteobacteria bacterium]